MLGLGAFFQTMSVVDMFDHVPVSTGLDSHRQNGLLHKDIVFGKEREFSYVFQRIIFVRVSF